MSEWISVKDKMPKEMNDILLLAFLDGNKREIFIGHQNNGIWYKCDFYESTELVNDPSILIVTHWMPLPEKPTECEILNEKLIKTQVSFGNKFKEIYWKNLWNLLD